MASFETQPERVLTIIDSAEVSGVLPHFRADILRAKVFCFSNEMLRQDSARRICEALLHHDSILSNPNYLQQVLELLLNASRISHDDEQMLRWATMLSDLLQQQGMNAEALRMEAEIGLALSHLGQEEEGLAKMDNALTQLKGLKTFQALDASVLAMKRKINVLSEMQRHDDIPPVAQRILDLLDDFEKHPEAYSDNSSLLPTDQNKRNDYCDFYGAQANAFMATAYADLGDTLLARQYLNDFMTSAYSGSLDGRKMIAPTLGKLGDYDKMLAICDEVERNLKGDTMRADYADILLNRAVAAEARGEFVASLAYRKRYEALTQRLSDRLQHNEAHLYAARFHAQEQQMEINEREAEAKRNGIIALALGIGLMAAIVFAIWFRRQKHIVNHKNRILVEQISGSLEYKRKYEELKEEQQRAQIATPRREQKATAEKETDSSIMPPIDLNGLSEEQLFQYLSDHIKREQLFLNPVCDRQTIIERFGISEKRVGSAFARGSNYKSLASFVRDCRLEYACHLLRQNPEMTIGNVALASGFSNHTRFTADFKSRYSVSPTEFRTLSE